MPSSHASRVRRLKPHLLATPAWVSPSFSRAALMRCERLPSSAIAVVGIISLLRFPSDFLRKKFTPKRNQCTNDSDPFATFRS